MKLVFSSIQWAIFILANSVVAPISVGAVFHLNPGEIASLLQRCLFVLGAGSLIQVLFGHKLPIPEGPAGLWWGVFLIFGNFAISMNLDPHLILRNIEMGLLISGFLFIIMGLFKAIDKIKQIFTPIVTGTYLFLLVAQLSASFIKGIMGVGYLSNNVDAKVAIPAIVTLIVTATLSMSRKPIIRSFSILYGIVFGWILFWILNITKPVLNADIVFFSIPEIFAFGMPKIDGGIILTSIITALLLLSNLIASVEVVKKVSESKEEPNYNKASFFMGINQILASIFSSIGFVPVSSAAGFVTTTKIKDKLPFIGGALLILIISFFPPVTLFFASLPVPVGYATIFLAFSNLIVMALKEYSTVLDDSSRLSIIGCSLMIGIGSMFIPIEALRTVPKFLTSVLNNGLILGVITCIILEQSHMILKKKAIS